MAQIEILVKSAPHLRDLLFKELPLTTLQSLRKSSQILNEALLESKIYWRKVFKKANICLCCKTIPAASAWVEILKFTKYKIVEVNAHEVIKFLARGDERYYRKTPLEFAAYLGHYRLFKILFENFEDYPEPKRSQYSLLHVAAEEGHLEVVKYLHQFEYYRSYEGDECRTPLHLSAKSGDLETFKYLFDNTEIKEPRLRFMYKTPLHYAIEYGNTKIVSFIMDNQSKLTIFERHL